MPKPTASPRICSTAVSYTHLDVYKRQLLDLSDAIVDIVETGTTLKENGLEVIEKIMPISARVIVNTCLLYTSRCV